MTLHWHVAQTKPIPSAWAVAERNLTKQGYNVFNPLIREVRRWSRGRCIEATRPYIPGYIFVRFDMDVDRWQPINWTPGVHSLMYSDMETPARVADRSMAALLGLTRGGYVDSEEADRFLFKAGQTVKVIADTVWGGWQGTVKLSAYDRVKIIIHLFGRPTEAEVAAKDLELVTS